MTRSPTASVHAARSSAAGENGSSKNDWEAWKTFPAPADPGFFPPELVVRVKAIACEFPAHVGEPLSRWSVAELGSHVRACGLTASLSDTTIWRWLNEDAIRPWQHRGQPMKVEHEYERLGAWAYLAALDVHQAKLFGRCEAKTGIAPFDRLVDQVMQQHPYRRARRVFWIVDNGSSHRGPRAVQRLQGKYPNLVLVHGPVHASWLNQIEIYFSIIQRKVLTPNDFSSRQTIARPFEWRFTRHDLTRLLRRLGHPAVKAA